MKALLNTIFVSNPDIYLALDGENLVLRYDQDIVARIPLHNLEAIVSYGRRGASPALMGKCMEEGIAITFLSNSGRLLGRVIGETNGNVLLRKTQYRLSDDEGKSCQIARNFIVGKLYNQRWQLERFTRDHELRVDKDQFKEVSQEIKLAITAVRKVTDLDTLRGIEGQAASRYFMLFDQMILQQKADFRFYGRNRWPPLDNVNALLSFAYTLLTIEVGAALETVGLDSYVGFLHRDRPGRQSLALDMIEELRCVVADRFVLSTINRKIFSVKDFVKKESGAVILTESARTRFLTNWQNAKFETLTHPFLNEKIRWGLVPQIQALLLARFLRGDLDEYPPFLWK